MLFGKKTATTKRYDDSIVHPDVRRLEERLREAVVDQDRAIKQFVRVHEAYMSGIAVPNRPQQIMLFVGPTGSGKTHVVEKFCEFMNVGLIKVDCAEFQHDHEVAKLIGAPPGYVGGNIEPKINKNAIEKKWKEEGAPQYTVVLFDEIEKADPAFHQLLLGILDKGKLTSGKNESIDMTQTVVVMTSNLGSKAIRKHLTQQTMGFIKTKTEEDQDDAIYQVGKSAVEHFFSPEFFNRVDRMVVFRPLNDVALRRVLECELKYVQDDLLRANKFIGLEVSERCKDFLIKEGTNREYGARELKRAVQRHLMTKVRRAIASDQAASKDVIVADYENDVLTLDIVKDALLLPKPKTEALTVKQPVAAHVEPEDPSARKAYESVKTPGYCGRCGFRWYEKHVCFDYVDELKKAKPVNPTRRYHPDFN
jgi:ATP-dependent Clp protease ATP-binding subunit ClpA